MVRVKDTRKSLLISRVLEQVFSRTQDAFNSFVSQNPSAFRKVQAALMHYIAQPRTCILQAASPAVLWWFIVNHFHADSHHSSQAEVSNKSISPTELKVVFYHGNAVVCTFIISFDCSEKFVHNNMMSGQN